MELPSAFKNRMKRMLGEEYDAFLAAFEKERSQGLRLNGLKAEQETFLLRCPFSLRPVPWAEEGYYYDAKDRPGRHPWHEAGVYYIQEPSAMAVAALLDPRPGERILDACAAPGGKTTQIAARMKGEGILVSNEIHPERSRILSQNVERMGIRNAVVTNEDTGRLAERFPQFFDRIVVDAPCSGEGMFRKEEAAASEWSEENVARCAERQQEILDNAAVMLRPGGRLVYSTCTFAPEEDEGAVARFLERHSEFELEPAPEREGLSHGRPEWGGENTRPDLADTVRIWPHKTEGEGHFIAVLRKGGETMEHVTGSLRRTKTSRKGRQPQTASRPELQEGWSDYQTFCRNTFARPEEWLCPPTGRFLLYGDQLYLCPEALLSLDGIRVLRPGLHLGTFKKKRFEPSHALALALKPEDAVQILYLQANEPRTAAYLHGEAISVQYNGASSAQGAASVSVGRPVSSPVKNGWILITVDGYSLGWGKAAGETVKNHYPKGLRK